MFAVQRVRRRLTARPPPPFRELQGSNNKPAATSRGARGAAEQQRGARFFCGSELGVRLFTRSRRSTCFACGIGRLVRAAAGLDRKARRARTVYTMRAHSESTTLHGPRPVDVMDEGLVDRLDHDFARERALGSNEPVELGLLELAF